MNCAGAALIRVGKLLLRLASPARFFRSVDGRLVAQVPVGRAMQASTLFLVSIER
jgi:hypothetical protein